jgi:hypothetical protein
MQESWEEWRREGKLSKSIMEVRETHFVAGSRRKKGYVFIPPPLQKSNRCSPGGGLSRSNRLSG